MPDSSVFIELMMPAIYGQICKYLLFLREFWIIVNFRGPWYYKIKFEMERQGKTQNIEKKLKIALQ